jgi:hypothetical protein
LPLLTYGLAIVLHGNGFVAAFVAGAFFALATRELPEDALNLTEDVGMLLSLVVWFIFGRAINQVAGGISWRVAWYAVLVVTVMRIVPVMLSLLGTSISRRDALFLVEPHAGNREHGHDDARNGGDQVRILDACADPAEQRAEVDLGRAAPLRLACAGEEIDFDHCPRATVSR